MTYNRNFIKNFPFQLKNNKNSKKVRTKNLKTTHIKMRSIPPTHQFFPHLTFHSFAEKRSILSQKKESQAGVFHFFNMYKNTFGRHIFACPKSKKMLFLSRLTLRINYCNFSVLLTQLFRISPFFAGKNLCMPSFEWKIYFLYTKKKLFPMCTRYCSTALKIAIFMRRDSF